jgi:hypothetical protein
MNMSDLYLELLSNIINSVRDVIMLKQGGIAPNKFTSSDIERIFKLPQNSLTDNTPVIENELLACFHDGDFDSGQISFADIARRINNAILKNNLENRKEE